METFWRLTSGDTASDYQHTFVNGEAYQEFALPTTICHSCRRVLQSNRTLPFECPADFQEACRIPRQGRHHLTMAEYASLMERIEPAVREAAETVGGVRPGDRFSPTLLKVPSRPVDDFLWPELGSCLVSSRVRDALEGMGATGIYFSPVRVTHAGKRSARGPVPIPGSGEPEDLLLRIPAPNAGDTETYSRVNVVAESGFPPGVDPASACGECGMATYDQDRRQIVHLPSMWSGSDISYLATTLWIIVTDRVRSHLEALGASNVRFVPVEQ